MIHANNIVFINYLFFYSIEKKLCLNIKIN